MNNIQKFEKLLKGCFKRKITVTAATMVAFLITGSVALSSQGEYLHNFIGENGTINQNTTNEGSKGIVNIYKGKVTIEKSIELNHEKPSILSGIAAVNIGKDSTVNNLGIINSDGIAVNVGGSSEISNKNSMFNNEGTVKGNIGVKINTSKDQLSVLNNEGTIVGQGKLGTAVQIIPKEGFEVVNNGLILAQSGANTVTIGLKTLKSYLQEGSLGGIENNGSIVRELDNGNYSILHNDGDGNAMYLYIKDTTWKLSKSSSKNGEEIKFIGVNGNDKEFQLKILKTGYLVAYEGKNYNFDKNGNIIQSHIINNGWKDIPADGIITMGILEGITNYTYNGSDKTTLWIGNNSKEGTTKVTLNAVDTRNFDPNELKEAKYVMTVETRGESNSIELTLDKNTIISNANGGQTALNVYGEGTKVINDGIIEKVGTSGLGAVNMNAGAELVNNGQIKAEGTAVALSNGSQLTNNKTISGTGDKIFGSVVKVNSDSKLTNNGLILAQGGANAVTIGFDTLKSYLQKGNTGGIVNNGSIVRELDNGNYSILHNEGNGNNMYLALGENKEVFKVTGDSDIQTFSSIDGETEFTLTTSNMWEKEVYEVGIDGEKYYFDKKTGELLTTVAGDGTAEDNIGTDKNWDLAEGVQELDGVEFTEALSNGEIYEQDGKYYVIVDGENKVAQEVTVNPNVGSPEDGEIPEVGTDKNWDLVSSHKIGYEKFEELKESGVEIVEADGKYYAVDRENNNAYQLIVDPKVEGGITDDEALLSQVVERNPYGVSTKMSYDSLMGWNNGIRNLKDMAAVGEWHVQGTYVGNYEENKGNVAHDSNTTGLLATAEYGIMKDTSLGIAFGGGKQKGELKNSSSKLESDSFYFGVYGKKNIDNFRILGSLGYQRNSFDIDRVLDNGLDRFDFSKSLDTDGFNAMLETRYVIPVRESLTIEPKFVLDYTHISQDSVSEGDKPMGMKVDSHDMNTYGAEIGADLVKTFGGNGYEGRAFAGLAYAYTGGDTDENLEARIGNGSKFEIEGAEIANNKGKVSIGVDIENTKGLNYGIGYTYEFGEDVKDSKVTVGLGYKF